VAEVVDMVVVDQRTGEPVCTKDPQEEQEVLVVVAAAVLSVQVPTAAIVELRILEQAAEVRPAGQLPAAAD
jgi:hypothetical protein